MAKFIDQMKRTVELTNCPHRIISLVPSQTELLYDLGLEDRVVGVTKFCVHPRSWLKSKTIVGGTKNVDRDIIDNLHPDLILGNKEENDEEVILDLQRHHPIWMSDITSLEDALHMIASISKLTDTSSTGDKIISQIQHAFAGMPTRPPASVLYLIWRKPWMGAASSTFIDTLLNKIGWSNVLGNALRYPELTEARIRELNPAVVLLSTEPYPFSDRHISEIRKILPQSFVQVVDGEMFSWYGSRLYRAPDYFSSLRFPS